MLKNYPYLWSKLRPLKRALWGLWFLLLAQMALTVLAPLPVKVILNSLSPGTDEDLHPIGIAGLELGFITGFQALVALSLLTFLLGCALIYSHWVQQIQTGKLTYSLMEAIRRDLFSRIFTRQQAYLDSKKKVDLLGRVSGDVSNLESLLALAFPAITRDIPMILALVGLMFLVNVKLTLLFAGALPLLYFLAHLYSIKMRAAAKTYRRQTAKFEEDTYEALCAMPVVKSLNGEEKLHQRLRERSAEITGAGKTLLGASQGMEASLGTLQAASQGILVFFGVWSIFRGELGIGDLFLLQVYLAALARHINQLSKFTAKYPKCSASMARLEELNNDLELNGEVSGNRPMPSGALFLSFKNVNFRHNETGRSIFSDFSFDFPEKGLICLVGPSGIGKSTFGRLLNRLNDPRSGQVEINGADMKEFELNSLRSQIRVITQETFLASGTVRENLLLGAGGEMPDEDLKNALDKVNALGFVSALPSGLDTRIGEGGFTLSGGQAKRIHLARAFLDKASKIILFDEPTSGLDTHSSERVLESIVALKEEKQLVFWITHRMREVFSADNLLFFRSHQNPAFATHSELYREDSHYRALHLEPQRSSSPFSAGEKREKNLLSEDETEEGLALSRF